MRFVKSIIFDAIDRLLRAPTTRAILRRRMADLFQSPPRAPLHFDDLRPPSDYPFLPNIDDLAHSVSPAENFRRPIFITARFRSGSTFLWQLFRELDGITSYYEPLNERNWLTDSSARVDPTHLGVRDYAAEYRRLPNKNAFDTSWAFHRLYLDEKDHHPKLATYLQTLIDASPGRAVLQFNRVDFRLAWLRVHFPTAHLLHLYRDPREQWVSILRKSRRQIPLNQLVKSPDWGRDLFYTYEWCQDLQGVFPFLDPDQNQHPYYFHYALWRLSYLYGRHFAQQSIAYESLVAKFDATLRALFQAIDLAPDAIDKLQSINQGQIKKHAAEYAPDDWYAVIERQCERVIRNYFSTQTQRSSFVRPEHVEV